MTLQQPTSQVLGTEEQTNEDLATETPVLEQPISQDLGIQGRIEDIGTVLEQPISQDPGSQGLGIEEHDG